jgi:hypothetical protein
MKRLVEDRFIPARAIRTEHDEFGAESEMRFERCKESEIACRDYILRRSGCADQGLWQDV